MESDKIKAIHSKDMKKYLESLGILNEVEHGKYKCEFCNKQILIDNISCLYPENRQVKFCCDNAKCYEIVIKKRAEKHA